MTENELIDSVRTQMYVHHELGIVPEIIDFFLYDKNLKKKEKDLVLLL